jgi:hypothetical protein
MKHAAVDALVAILIAVAALLAAGMAWTFLL